MATAVRWNIVVSEDTDLSLRRHLGARGMRKGDLSKFIEDAVRWRLLDEAAQKIKVRNKRRGAKEVDRRVGHALAESRRRSAR